MSRKQRETTWWLLRFESMFSSMHVFSVCCFDLNFHSDDSIRMSTCDPVPQALQRAHLFDDDGYHPKDLIAVEVSLIGYFVTKM